MCFTCQSLFLKSDLDNQITGVHEKKKPFNAPSYSSSFSEEGVLKKDSIIFLCSMCPSKFDQKSLLTEQIDSVHEKRKLFCSQWVENSANYSNDNNEQRTKNKKQKPLGLPFLTVNYVALGVQERALST